MATTNTAKNNHNNLPPLQERWSESNIREVISLFGFNAKEEAKLRELKTMALQEDAMDHWKNDPIEVARYLAEFRKLSTPKIFKLWRNMVEYRLKDDIDNFCQRYGNPSAVFQYLPLYLMEDLDYDGNPLYVARVGALDAWGMYQRVGPQAMLDYTRFIQEITTTRYMQGVCQEFNWQPHYYEPKAGRRLAQFTMLVDLEGLSPRHLRPALFSVLGQIARLGQDYYAGFAKRIIFLRAPRIFQLGWNMVKHFFDPHIIALINITTAQDYLEVCDKYFDRRSLPACMAPGEGEGRPMPGFFECIQMEGGPIPEHLDIHTPCETPWMKRSRASFSERHDDEEHHIPRPCRSTKLFSGVLDHTNRVVIRKERVGIECILRPTTRQE